MLTTSVLVEKRGHHFHHSYYVCSKVQIDLSYVVTVKSTVDISQNFVASSEYMKFKAGNANFKNECTTIEICLKVSYLSVHVSGDCSLAFNSNLMLDNMFCVSVRKGHQPG